MTQNDTDGRGRREAPEETSPLEWLVAALGALLVIFAVAGGIAVWGVVGLARPAAIGDGIEIHEGDQIEGSHNEKWENLYNRP